MFEVQHQPVPGCRQKPFGALVFWVQRDGDRGEGVRQPDVLRRIAMLQDKRSVVVIPGSTELTILEDLKHAGAPFAIPLHDTTPRV
ncbi:hypothetical protein D3C71_1915890 [compost metagenome]